MIKDIQCGNDHNLALDANGRVYSFGANHLGQCGDSSTKHVDTPKMIKYLKNYTVLQIDCGSNHSYCRVAKHCVMDGEQDKHYLFGSNKYNECITYDNAINNGQRDKCFNNIKVVTPHCINDIIEEKSNGKIIKAVYLGHHNTKIILSDV